MELGLPPRSTGHDFLEQSRESKRLSHEWSKPGKACLKRPHLENTRIRTLRGVSILTASDVSCQYQWSVDQPQGSTGRAVDLRDLLEAQVEASK